MRTDAIVIRDFSTGSYISRNTTQTNTPRSIKALNTVQNGAGIKLGISYNTLTDPTYGIRLINVVAASSGTNKVTIDNNLITLNGSATTRYGIWCENSNYTEVYCNNISRTTLPASNYRLTIRGIQMNQCINGKVRDNTTIKLGIGIKGAGSLLGTQFKCNTSNGNYNGFYFDAAYNSVQTVTSDQGTFGFPNDNQWYNVPSGYYMIDAATGFSQSIKSWYYRTSAGYVPTISINALGGFNTSPSSNPLGSGCTSCGGTLSLINSGSLSTSVADSNTDELNEIMNGSNDYKELDASFKYFEKQYAFSKLSGLPTLASASQSNYLETLKTGNIGLFDKLYEHIQDENYDSAAMLNKSIAPENEIETKRQWVNQVYLDFVLPQVSLPQTTIDELVTLASSSPFVYGDAVYTARAIVNYNEPVLSNPKSMDMPLDTSTSGILQVKVYPNPANDYIYIDIVGKIEYVIDFIIIDMLGTIHNSFQIKDNTFNVNIQDLSQGIYWYQAKCADKIISYGKLIISR